MNKTFRKISVKIHLWLGLLSGIVVFIVCITGSLYCFKDEINNAVQTWRFVTPETKPVLYPSEVIDIANTEIKNDTPTAITYGESSDAVFVDYFNPDKGMQTVFINPYNGTVLKIVTKSKDEFDFFKFVISGHRSLWLPREIGKPIVGYGVLIFVVTLITGMVLWWPKKWNKNTVRKKITIKRRPFFRLNWDLHNVLGGYAFIFLLIICFTGMIRSFGWFSESVYYITSGGKRLQPYNMPKSDTLQINSQLSDPLDRLYARLRKEESQAKILYFALPGAVDGVIRVSVVHARGSHYKTDNLFFDQYTLEVLEGKGPYAGRYKDAAFADKLRRMNLEIHDGRILGLPGKILAFLVSLIGASLPVTGVIVWYRKLKRVRSDGSIC